MFTLAKQASMWVVLSVPIHCTHCRPFGDKSCRTAVQQPRTNRLDTHKDLPQHKHVKYQKAQKS